MYDTETAHRNCIGKIAEWRRSSRLLFKVPRGNITDRMWILIMGTEENLDVEKSPDEEMLIEINKYSQCRDHLLGELSIQWSTWKQIKPELEKFLSQNKIYS